MNRSSYQACLHLARRLCPAELAEDLLQEALIIAARQTELDLDQGPARAWLAGVIKNLLRQHQRQQLRSQRRDGEWLSHTSDPNDSAPVAFPDPDNPSNPDEIHDAHSTALLQRLSPRQRQLFALIAHGLNRDEIRWILNINDNTLRQRIHALSQNLKPLAPEQRHQLLALAYHSRQRPDAPLDLGPIRRQLRQALRHTRNETQLGLSDPDGHLLIVDCPDKQEKRKD